MTAVAPDIRTTSSWWNDTKVYALRHLRHIRETPEKLFDVTIQPLMFVVLFAYVFGGAIDVQGSSYREYILGGILIQSLAFGMVGPGIAIATDLTEGVIDRFRSLPTARSAYLSGHVLAEMGGLGVSVVVLLTTGLGVGWRAHTDVLHIAGAIGLLLLFAAAMVMCGTLLGLLARTPDAVMGVAFTSVFPLTFVSNAFVPIESMPTFLQHVSAWNPVSVVVAAVRELFGNPTAPADVSSWPLEHPVAAGVLWCVAILAVTVPLCLRRYRARTTD